MLYHTGGWTERTEYDSRQPGRLMKKEWFHAERVLMGGYMRKEARESEGDSGCVLLSLPAADIAFRKARDTCQRLFYL